MFSKQINERVTGIDAGFISNMGYTEFIISTFSGRILGLVDAENKFKQENIGLFTQQS